MDGVNLLDNIVDDIDEDFEELIESQPWEIWMHKTRSGG